MDECTEIPEVCGPNANCTNAVGNYTCMCLNGYNVTNPYFPINISHPCRGTSLNNCFFNRKNWIALLLVVICFLLLILLNKHKSQWNWISCVLSMKLSELSDLKCSVNVIFLSKTQHLFHWLLASFICTYFTCFSHPPHAVSPPALLFLWCA